MESPLRTIKKYSQGLMKDDIKLINKTWKFIKKLDEAQSLALERVLRNSQRQVILSFTKNFPIHQKGIPVTPEKSPIDTGRLRRSIKAEQKDGEEGKVYTNVEYAAEVEYGNTRMPPRPYFRKGMKDAEEYNKRIIASVLKEFTKDV